ncbi:MAG: restriction endonuclease [gamma proteobacterium endosymbiont of Lamellibrachia anaximandri]|nr:restriction endonuclease [gamma proteobacterium endosymbiont of Lamellibrachia anaximandri]
MSILDYSEVIEEISPTDLTEDHFPPLLSTNIQAGFFLKNKGYCRYCGIEMLSPINEVEDGGGRYDHVHRVHQCHECSWWWEEEYEDIYIGGGDRLTKERKRFGILKRYDVDDIEIPMNTLRGVLSQDNSLLYHLHPTKFEKLVGSVFRDHLDCEVRHLGRTGDGGIDLLLIQGEKQTVIQVKRRSNKSATEGVAPIRELIGAMILRGNKNGVFVTTANTFSGPAKSAASLAPKKTSDIEKIELVDCGSLIELLNLTMPKISAPWKNRNWSIEYW